MSLKHNINDYVLYRNNGICRITEICPRDFGDGERLYFIMQSVYDKNNVFFVPADKEDQLKHVLSVDEIDSIIDRSGDVCLEWPEDTRERTDVFGEILREGDRPRLLCMIKLLSLHKTETEADKKKFYANDQKTLAAAERLIQDEFAYVLGIPRDEVSDYIVRRITAEAENE